jgi:chromosome segregation ATPase
LRKLELLSTLDVRLQKIQEQINANSDDIAAIRQELAAAGDYNELRNKITGDELAIKLLEQRLLKFESQMNDIWQVYRYQPRYYIPRGRGEPNSGSTP